nr:MAG TPA: hypothetical protein [Caudoviricetes sp.]
MSLISFLKEIAEATEDIEKENRQRDAAIKAAKAANRPRSRRR